MNNHGDHHGVVETALALATARLPTATHQADLVDGGGNEYESTRQP